MVNTANRQLAVGDADLASPGAIKPLLGVRFFDAKAQYAVGDFVIQGGALYRSNAAITPAAFNATQWDVFATNVTTKAYIDALTEAIVGDYEAADAALITSINGKVMRTATPCRGRSASRRCRRSRLTLPTQYVDERIAAGGVVTLPALSITYAPGGTVSSTNVQAAIAELDTEKAPIYSPAFQGQPTAPVPIANDNSTKLATTSWVNTYTVTYVTSFMVSYVESSLDAIVGNAMPKPIGTAAVGTATRYSRVAAPTTIVRFATCIGALPFRISWTMSAPPGDDDTSIATTAWVQAIVRFRQWWWAVALATSAHLQDRGRCRLVMFNDGNGRCNVGRHSAPR
jgi:hypothetical protein